MPVWHGVFEKYDGNRRGVADDYIACDCGGMAGFGNLERKVTEMDEKTQKLLRDADIRTKMAQAQAKHYKALYIGEIKRWGVDACDKCQNQIPCLGKECDCFESGDSGEIDGKPVRLHWTCEDFDYGTCRKMAGTPCERCGGEYVNFILKEETDSFILRRVNRRFLSPRSS